MDTEQTHALTIYEQYVHLRLFKTVKNCNYLETTRSYKEKEQILLK